MKIEDYSPDELAEIFKEELDRLDIPYHYDLDAEVKFALAGHDVRRDVLRLLHDTRWV